MIYRDTLEEEERLRRDRRITRAALPHYSHSPFSHLYHSGNDQALINLSAMGHHVFQELLELFAPVYSSFTLTERYEWGMGLISKQFPRLRDKLTRDNFGERIYSCPNGAPF